MFRSKNKIVSLDKAKEIVSEWKKNDENIVFTNGCFDIVHLGHLDYLEKARNLGDKLVLGLNSDVSISSIKGESRPVIKEESRARLMASLAYVDLVIIFGDNTPLILIETLLPNTLVKGNDYTIENIVGAKETIAAGGSVKTIELVKGHSTSAIIERILKKG